MIAALIVVIIMIIAISITRIIAMIIPIMINRIIAMIKEV